MAERYYIIMRSWFSLLVCLLLAIIIFTKVVCPAVHYWRANGLRIVVYLDDDGLRAVTGKQAALEASQLVRITPGVYCTPNEVLLATYPG